MDGKDTNDKTTVTQGFIIDLDTGSNIGTFKARPEVRKLTAMNHYNLLLLTLTLVHRREYCNQDSLYVRLSMDPYPFTSQEPAP